MVSTLSFTANRLLASQKGLGDRWIGEPQSYTGEVIEVIDGDTLQVRLDQGEKTIQLCGIQSPEPTEQAAAAKVLLH